MANLPQAAAETTILSSRRDGDLPQRAAPPRDEGTGIRIRDRNFPKGFVWGVATAAPQVEGAAQADGKGDSIWDVFARLPDRVSNRDTPEIACDHYYRYEEDLGLMAGMGVKDYRFSIAWPRIFPAGRGAINPRGIDFYNRLIDAMLAKGIRPWVTMFHWDLPQTLELEGGWRVRETTEAFRTYAETIVRNYGDRVKNWITMNEIQCFTEFGYGDGKTAPGVREGAAVVNQTFHHAILCHGLGVQAVREFGGSGARVGLTDNIYVPVPVTDSADDIAAARQQLRAKNARVIDPIYNRGYGAEYLANAGAAAPRFHPRDFDLISQPTDFLGLNIYTGWYVRAGATNAPEVLPYPAHYPQADSPWLKLNARALYWGPRLVAEVYGVQAIYVTENGAGYDEGPPVQGEVIDLHRLEYIRSCLTEVQRAIEDGVPIHGYFLWSFMDNFEWQDGYKRRFGVIYVDFATQARIPKLSAEWYSKTMAANRVV